MDKEQNTDRQWDLSVKSNLFFIDSEQSIRLELNRSSMTEMMHMFYFLRFLPFMTRSKNEIARFSFRIFTFRSYFSYK